MNSLEREYRSDLARRYIAQGRREGRLQTALKLLALRFGPLTEPVEALVRSVEDAELDVFTHWALVREYQFNLFRCYLGKGPMTDKTEDRLETMRKRWLYFRADGSSPPQPPFATGETHGSKPSPSGS
jgi:hypothetical protein